MVLDLHPERLGKDSIASNDSDVNVVENVLGVMPNRIQQHDLPVQFKDMQNILRGDSCPEDFKTQAYTQALSDYLTCLDSNFSTHMR